MKTIGLIGGMSWESTITYYQVLNETIKQALGGLHSAKCILYSVDFEEIENKYFDSKKELYDLGLNFDEIFGSFVEHPFY